MARRPVPGVRGPCAVSAGPLSECEREPIECAEDACWRLVDCGALAVNRPDEDEDCGFCDWRSCVAFVEDLPDGQYDLALNCVEAATCDQLKAPGSPEDPDPPPCLEQGDDD